MVAATRFRTIRNRVFSACLKPLGFLRSGTVLYRHVGDQVHGIDYQVSKYGGEYAINLGFGYSFLANPFSSVRRNDTIHLLDYPVRARLGVIVCGRDDWSPFSETESELETTFRANIDAAIRELDSRAITWKDSSWFLDRISPDFLLMELPNEVGVDQPAMLSVLEGWEPEVDEMSLFCAQIALHLSKHQLAREYAEVGLKICDVVPVIAALKDVALLGLVWVQIKASAMEVDRIAEACAIAKASCRVFDPLDFGVQAFTGRVGDVMR